MSEFEDRLRSAWVDDNGPAPEVETAVLAEFDRVIRARRRSRWMLGVAAVAAGLIVAWSGARGPQMEPVAPTAEASFTALPYVIQPAMYESTEVVRMTVPVAELVAAGMRLEADPGAHVEADVMVGQDGRARAVRLISSSEQ